MTPCKFPECDQRRASHGYCGSHARQFRAGETIRPLRQQVPRLQRFWSKVAKADTCWLWTAGTNNMGYGMFWNPAEKRMELAHRYSYELHHGPIAQGMVICHRCDTPPCVNPEHLFVGTQAENLADMWAKGRRHDGPTRPTQKHCPLGHELDGTTTRNGRVEHYCRECTRRQNRASAAARKLKKQQEASRID